MIEAREPPTSGLPSILELLHQQCSIEGPVRSPPLVGLIRVVHGIQLMTVKVEPIHRKHFALYTQLRDALRNF
eukprot:CAMPEP_0172038138 /NCGR_PEP_ID=MMETSP1041-20130122/23144_1 /TAXON_ID=464988 /ORGANISM="Hemiselmis andersenii, Strain CCMP439" /LENGTH=72 /DNA_ID=CAMNT_0012695627 /DNA_START=303 /DNA_END=521 /DNA_ORIENTATION=+